MVAELIVRAFELFVVFGILALGFVVWLYHRHNEDIERSYMEQPTRNR